MNQSSWSNIESVEAWARALSDGQLDAARTELERRKQLPPADMDWQYRQIAERHGWRMGGDNEDIIYNSRVLDSWKEAVSWSGDEACGDRVVADTSIYSTWSECCEGEDFAMVLPDP